MFTLDANIFVRDVDPSAPAHAECQALITRLRADSTPMIMPLIILAEVSGAVSSTFRDPIRGRLTADLLRNMPNVTLISLDAALAQEAAELAADLALRGMDAIYVATARRHGCTLVTLDDEPLKRAGAVIPVRTPATALADLDRLAT